MALLIRMALYFMSAMVAGQGIAIFNADAGTLTFDLESVATFATGTLTFVGTYVAGRVAKARGGLT